MVVMSTIRMAFTGLKLIADRWKVTEQPTADAPLLFAVDFLLGLLHLRVLFRRSREAAHVAGRETEQPALTSAA